MSTDPRPPFAYDPLGRVVVVRDPPGAVTWTVSDVGASDGRPDGGTPDEPDEPHIVG